jgi:hypothetical protein
MQASASPSGVAVAAVAVGTNVHEVDVRMSLGKLFTAFPQQKKDKLKKTIKIRPR